MSAAKVVSISVNDLEAVTSFMRSAFDANNGMRAVLLKLAGLGGCDAGLLDALRCLSSYEMDMLNSMDVVLEQVHGACGLPYSEGQS